MAAWFKCSRCDPAHTTTTREKNQADEKKKFVEFFQIIQFSHCQPDMRVIFYSASRGFKTNADERVHITCGFRANGCINWQEIESRKWHLSRLKHSHYRDLLEFYLIRANVGIGIDIGWQMPMEIMRKLNPSKVKRKCIFNGIRFSVQPHGLNDVTSECFLALLSPSKWVAVQCAVEQQICFMENAAFYEICHGLRG